MAVNKANLGIVTSQKDTKLNCSVPFQMSVGQMEDL